MPIELHAYGARGRGFDSHLPYCGKPPRRLVNASHKSGVVAQRIERVKRFIILVVVLDFQFF